MSRLTVLLWIVVVWGAQASSTTAQTVGVGIKLPVELNEFHTGRLTDNLEIFGQAAWGTLAFEIGALMPFSPLVVGAALKFSFLRIDHHNEEGERLWTMPFFIGGGGILISFGDLSFTALLIKAGCEWHSNGFPLRVILEGGWQSPISVLQGTGGPLLSLGLRWDL